MSCQNHHVARLHYPNEYSSFSKTENEFGDGIHGVHGIRIDNQQNELQAIHFSKAKFTIQQARQWIDDNGYTPI